MMASNAVPVMGKRGGPYRTAVQTPACPFGRKARRPLGHKGYGVWEHRPTSRAGQYAFQAGHGVETTPRAVVDDGRIEWL